MADGVSGYRMQTSRTQVLTPVHTNEYADNTYEVSSRDISDYRFSLFLLTQILLVCTTSSSPFPSSFSHDMPPGFLIIAALIFSSLLFHMVAHLRLPRWWSRLHSHRCHHIHPIPQATILRLVIASLISWLTPFHDTAVELRL